MNYCLTVLEIPQIKTLLHSQSDRLYIKCDKSDKHLLTLIFYLFLVPKQMLLTYQRRVLDLKSHLKSLLQYIAVDIMLNKKQIIKLDFQTKQN